MPPASWGQLVPSLEKGLALGMAGLRHPGTGLGPAETTADGIYSSAMPGNGETGRPEYRLSAKKAPFACTSMQGVYCTTQPEELGTAAPLY